MERHRFEGIWLPLITPFADGALDEPSVAALVRHYLEMPIDGLILAATTGEGLTLDAAETERLVAIAAETAGGKVPLLLGLSGSNTGAMARRIREIQTWPVAGYLVTCPYYSRPSQEGLAQHFQALAAETEKPILLYNIPYRTGVNLANETALRLAEHPCIVGIKDCCANLAQTFDLLRARPPGFAVLTGEDALLFTHLRLGADGGILASAHVETESIAAMRRALLAGERETALRVWSGLADIVTLLFAESSPGPIKHWLWREGRIASPELRLPMTGVGAALAGRIDRAIARHRGSRSAVHAGGGELSGDLKPAPHAGARR